MNDSITSCKGIAEHSKPREPMLHVGPWPNLSTQQKTFNGNKLRYWHWQFMLLEYTVSWEGEGKACHHPTTLGGF